MNAKLVEKALAVVGNANILVNLISRRVRQLNSGGGRSLVVDSGQMRAADIALLEIIENKMGFDAPAMIKLTRSWGRNLRRPQGWANPPAATSKVAA